MSVRYRWGSHIRSYRWRSIFLKYFAMLFHSLFVLIVVVNVVYYVLYNGVLREEAFAANENALEKTAAFMDGALRNAENLSANLIIDYEAEFFLNEKLGSLSREYHNQNYLIKKMSGLVTAGEYYESIFLYSESRDEILDTAYGLSGRGDFYDAQWYDHYLKRPNMPWAFSRVVDIKPLKITQRLISYIIPFNIGTTQRRGAVVVNFNIERIKRMIDRSAEPAGSLFILDPGGAVLYDTGLAHLGVQAEAVEALGAYLQTQAVWPDSFRFADADGRDMVCSCYVSEKNGWRYISIVPFDLLSEMAQRFQTVIFLTLLGGCLAAALIAFFLAVRVYAPIKTIVDLLDDTDAEGHGAGSAQNEIKLIVKNLMNMLDSRRNLEDELTRRLLLLRKAQSVALQTQINPHFLYNTLESINWKAIRLTHGENDVTRMIGTLSHILSYALDTEENLVALKTELAYTERYIAIQQERHQNRFDVEWQVDPALHDTLVLKLMFQPLVENAMYHGILPQQERGLIRISVAQADGLLQAQVWDNGRGMPAEQVEAVRRQLREPVSLMKESHHIGLCNVNQRIRVVFGEQYELSIESELGLYTNVRIVLPTAQNSEPFNKI